MCPRCKGLMLRDREIEPEAVYAYYCVNCGYRIDKLLLKYQKLSRENNVLMQRSK